MGLRFRDILAAAAVIACAAVPAPLLHRTLAATASILFEAAPFVLALGLLRGRALGPAAALAGCGCGSAAGPAALSLPATGLCWITFGPVVAVARFAAAWLLHVRRLTVSAAEPPDVLAQFGAIAAPAFAFALATESVRLAQPASVLAGLSPPLVAALELAAGLGAGALSPCCTAAVALAAMLRVPAPFAAAGVLVTAGIVPALRASATPRARMHDARFGLALLGCACALLAARNGSGFVHPRLVPLLWSALPAALLAVRTRPATRARFGALFPAAMVAMLAFGSPAPPGTAATSPLDGIYPGEAIAFTGIATLVRGRTTLIRYAITCCRADATALALPTDLRLRFARDQWLAVSGTVARDDGGLIVHATEWQRVPQPPDPYLYR